MPVVVIGSDQFPAFYSRSSGHPAPRRVDDAATGRGGARRDVERAAVAARHLHRQPDLGRTTRSRLTEIDGVIVEALTELNAQGIVGQAVTPFLLSRIVEQTGGRSLTANVSLVKHNAAIAADIAVEYARTRPLAAADVRPRRSPAKLGQRRLHVLAVVLRAGRTRR